MYERYLNAVEGASAGEWNACRDWNACSDCLYKPRSGEATGLAKAESVERKRKNGTLVELFYNYLKFKSSMIYAVKVL